MNLNIEKDLDFKHGISIVIPDSDFSESGISGKINLEKENLPKNILKYGKAVILPENYDFTNSNNGKVTFTKELVATKLNIWCDNTTVVGFGTILYPNYYPAGTQHKSVKWLIISGLEYCKIKMLKIVNISNNEFINHDLLNCCYVEILPNANNSDVIIKCQSLGKSNMYLHKFIKLNLTYDPNVQSSNSGIVSVTNENGNSTDRISNTTVKLNVNFYPPNIADRKWELDFTNDSLDVTDYIGDTKERLLKKQNIWEDIIKTVRYEYDVYDENTKTYHDEIYFDLPKFWLMDMMFDLKIKQLSENNYTKSNIVQRVLFPIDYKDTLYEYLDIEMKDLIGYVELSSAKNLIYFNINHEITSEITQNITRKYFKNPSIGPKIISNYIMTPQNYVKKYYKNTDNILEIKYIVDKFVDLEVLDLSEINTNSLQLYGYIIYNNELNEFFIAYHNDIYLYTLEYFDYNDDTIFYYDGDLYNYDKSEGLKLIYKHDINNRINRSGYDIGYLIPNVDKANSEIFNIWKTTKRILWSSTFQKMAKKDYFNIISKNSNLIGDDQSNLYIQIQSDILSTNQIVSGIYKYPINLFGHFLNITDTKLENVFQMAKEKYVFDNNDTPLNRSNTIYFNYSGSYGEYQDIKDYKDKLQLKNAVDSNKICGNIQDGKLYDLIIYNLENELFKRYTYYKDYPKSIDDLINMRNIADIDLKRNVLGEIVNVGLSNKFVFSK